MLIGLAMSGVARATVTLPAIFSDHMVVQAGRPIAVWGWAAAGEKISLRLGPSHGEATAGTDGKFSARLAPLPASAKPQTLTVRGSNTVTASDVLVGEVWLCSGQSNMEMQLKGLHGAVDHADAEIAAAEHPTLRMFQFDAVYDIYQQPIPPSQPQRDRPGRWIVCSPATAAHFIAFGYFFAREVQQALHEPVGLVHSSVGGTPIEAWTSAEAQAAVPALQPLLADWEKRLAGYDPAADERANLAARQKWQPLAAAAKARGETPPKAPPPFKNWAVSTPAGLYNGMIAPLIPYTMRGVLWYQGESNVIDNDDGDRYADKMTALVAGWRKAWGYDFPVYYVQIAPHLYHVQRPNTVVYPDAEPRLWEAQTASMRLPNTGMVVTTDLVDDLFDIHPRDKKDVGERLARWALNRDYGYRDIVVSGPLFSGMTIDGDKAILSFDDIGGGLVARDGRALNWFDIAGADGRFYPATAVIDGDRVVVSSPKVAAPAAVHFAWDEGAQPNFFNKAGLPAAPFRTENPLAVSSDK